MGAPVRFSTTMSSLGRGRQRTTSHIYVALTLALNAGVRDAELRGLTWAQIKFAKGYLVVGKARQRPGEGRTIPPNSSPNSLEKCPQERQGDGEVARQPAHAHHGSCGKRCGRSDHHGHRRPCSKRMPRHYSHIRMEAKRTALESIVKKQTSGAADHGEDSRSMDGAKSVGYPHRTQGYRNGRGEKSEPKVDCSESIAIVPGFDLGYPQKSTIGYF